MLLESNTTGGLRLVSMKSITVSANLLSNSFPGIQKASVLTMKNYHWKLHKYITLKKNHSESRLWYIFSGAVISSKAGGPQSFRKSGIRKFAGLNNLRTLRKCGTFQIIDLRTQSFLVICRPKLFADWKPPQSANNTFFSLYIKHTYTALIQKVENIKNRFKKAAFRAVLRQKSAGCGLLTGTLNRFADLQ